MGCVEKLNEAIEILLYVARGTISHLASVAKIVNLFIVVILNHDYRTTRSYKERSIVTVYSF